MPQLSILIPSQDVGEAFESTLISVLQNRPDDCEVVVVLPFAYDDPFDLADEVRFVHGERAEWTALANAGVEVAAAPIVHLLDAGVIVDEGWTQAALAAFDDRQIGSVAPLVVDPKRPERLAMAGLRYGYGGRRILQGQGRRLAAARRLPTAIDAAPRTAGFFRRSLLTRLDGFDAAMGDHWADVDTGLAVKALGYRNLLVTESRVTGTANDSRNQGSFALGRQAERIFWRHAARRGWVRSLLTHPLTVFGDCLDKLAGGGLVSQLVGRAVANLEWGHARRFADRIESAGQVRLTLVSDSEATSAPTERDDLPSADNRRRAA